MLSATGSGGVRLGPDGVRLGPMGSDWVISHTERKDDSKRSAAGNDVRSVDGPAI